MSIYHTVPTRGTGLLRGPFGSTSSILCDPIEPDMDMATYAYTTIGKTGQVRILNGAVDAPPKATWSGTKEESKIEWGTTDEDYAK